MRIAADPPACLAPLKCGTRHGIYRLGYILRCLRDEQGNPCNASSQQNQSCHQPPCFLSGGVIQHVSILDTPGGSAIAVAHAPRQSMRPDLYTLVVQDRVMQAPGLPLVAYRVPWLRKLHADPAARRLCAWRCWSSKKSRHGCQALGTRKSPLQQQLH